MDKERELRQTKDPTKTLLSKSDLHEKYLCDYVLNIGTGCRHGCVWCYVPGTPNIRARQEMLKEEVGVEDSQEEWGDYVLYRTQIPAELPGTVDRKRKWKETDKGLGTVGISFHTDAYMDAAAAELATQAVRILTDRGHHVRVLTRAPMNAATHPIRRDPAGRVTLRGEDALANAGNKLTVGASINSLNNGEVTAIERNAPPVEARIQGLKRLDEAGVQTYVSMSPTYPTQDKSDLRALMKRLDELDPSVIFHEPINPRGDNFELTVAAAEKAGEIELAKALTEIQSPSAWAEYACNHYRWVQELGDEMGLPVHLWPDKALVKQVSDKRQQWLQKWRDRQPPEEFANRETPSNSMPTLPPVQQTLG
jgi:DNA repair photolyase